MVPKSETAPATVTTCHLWLLAANLLPPSAGCPISQHELHLNQVTVRINNRGGV